MEKKHPIALVTGGGTGIGRATAIELARRGAVVAVNYSRSQVEAKETVQFIIGEGGQAIAIQADVSKDEEVRRMVANIAERFGGLNYLINNASITRHIPLDDLEAAVEEVWDELYAVNVKGMFYCARAAAHGLTKSLARALAPEIRVCSVAPGAVATRWWAGREEQMSRLSGHLPLQRISTAEDIAGLICSILEQPSLTGQIITADSGQTM
ncbi:SDR family NAD(P)-dependent oxidoreductase [Paenibacillus sp. H1-7]|uniref:SDR family NAD(P)-dependent oxidoreductase n=1 Tax=Paenibacillus sp. H1-7 TaxID=2282849 RepID=UPI001EF7829B|nr:SDR family NAD(P)-dependent oxidoreductase [Paenibacillus sp. H1-7]ULL13480.1 SDR family NAD(P)-dependent oxidoreductase [Paenibacillus sp. H1-7]